MDPAVVDSELAPTSESVAITCGNDADRPEPTNRPVPITTRATVNNTQVGMPKASRPASTAMATDLIRLAQMITCLRLHRSSSAPANGPMIEYGNSRTAKPAAMSAGVERCDGSNSTTLANAPWNAPSPNEVSSRTVTSRRRPATRSNGLSPRADGFAARSTFDPTPGGPAGGVLGGCCGGAVAAAEPRGRS